VLEQAEVMNLLDTCYGKVCTGVPVISKPVDEFSAEYLNKYHTPERAAKKMISAQISKCGTSGFITGFGGILTLPVAIPANIGSVLYVQMRMIASTAYMGGFNTDSDEVQTFVYACLAGVSVGDILKQSGIKFGNKFAISLIGKIPGKVLTKINQRVGFRFITKFGEKGIINLGKTVPVVGAVIGGGFDIVSTKAIGNRAYKMFIEEELF